METICQAKPNHQSFPGNLAEPVLAGIQLPRWKQYVEMTKQVYLLQFLSKKHVIWLVLTGRSGRTHYLSLKICPAEYLQINQ